MDCKIANTCQDVTPSEVFRASPLHFRHALCSIPFDPTSWWPLEGFDVVLKVLMAIVQRPNLSGYVKAPRNGEYLELLILLPQPIVTAFRIVKAQVI